MKTLFPLNRDGAVTNYLVTEPKIEDFQAPFTLKDQLEFERRMREIFYLEPEGVIPDSALGELSPLGTKWQYYAKNRNPYVDFSTFYFTLKRVSFYARTTLVSDKDRVVKARVWSYAAFDMWLSGKKVATERVPVYQPIRYTDVTLSLSEGENDVFFYIQNFGVRDTRNMLKFQLLDTEGISVTLPIEDSMLADFKAAEEWLCLLCVKGNKLLANTLAPFEATISLDDKKQSFGKAREYDISGIFKINVNINLHNQSFSRTIECYANRKISYRKIEENDPRADLARAILDKSKYGIISAEEFYKVQGHASMNYVLCSLKLSGKISEYDEAVIRCALDYVRERRDCSDFELSEMLRLVLTFDVPKKLLSEIKEVALIFRYWMDEEGADAMCFWSENHSLLFYGCQMLAGRIWQNELFLRSKRLGKEQYEIGKRRVSEWFDVVLAEGFEEFLAGGYMGVTIAALLTVYDFTDGALKESAKRVLDRIATESCTQCFKGAHVAPMGRVYRGVLTPYVSSVQSLLHLLSDDNIDYSCPRIANYFLSDYTFPEGLSELMFGELATVFNSGRAEIHTKKTKDYILTSVASPRSTPTVEIADETTEYFKTKVMNEGFHGTTLFVPGVGGYQQHLWYAAISEKFITFVSLPGVEKDYSGMRPGYWFGNLVFPYVKQNGKELYVRYVIPDSVPTKFTHAYFPATLADELCEKDGFRFARVGESYIAIYCSEPLSLREDDVVSCADLIAYGTDTCWYVRVGSESEDGSFESFVSSCLNKELNRKKITEFLS